MGDLSGNDWWSSSPSFGVSDWAPYPNFSEAEFKCKCCGDVRMHQGFMAKLQHLRSSYKRPMIITSGYRCANHPVEAKKPTPGVHSYGRAADIAVRGRDAYDLVSIAIRFGFTGIGIQQKGEGRFIHLDDSTSSNRPAIWSY
jgi:zinc D-Ala-D-Ala carboxypeptidase